MMNTIDVEREDHTTAEEGIEIETGRTRDGEEKEGGIERDPSIHSDMNKRDLTEEGEEVVEDGMETDLGMMKDERGGRGNLSLKLSGVLLPLCRAGMC